MYHILQWLKIICFIHGDQKEIVGSVPWQATFTSHIPICSEMLASRALSEDIAPIEQHWNGGILTGWWFFATPLKNMSSSVGMMKFPMYGKIKNDPNHQPAKIGVSLVIIHSSAMFHLEINHPAIKGYPHFPSWKPPYIAGVGKCLY